jgi:hypothetical protein
MPVSNYKVLSRVGRGPVDLTSLTSHWASVYADGREAAGR